MEDPKKALLDLVDEMPLDEASKVIARRGIERMPPEKIREHLEKLTRALAALKR